MSSKQKSDGFAVNQGDYVVPNITIKELLEAIPWVLGHTVSFESWSCIGPTASSVLHLGLLPMCESWRFQRQSTTLLMSNTVFGMSLLSGAFTRPQPSLTVLLVPLPLIYTIPLPTALSVLHFGRSMVSGPVFSELAFGSSPTNAVTKPSQNPKS